MNRYVMTFLDDDGFVLEFYAPSDEGAAEHADATWRAEKGGDHAAGFELRREGDLRVIHRGVREVG